MKKTLALGGLCLLGLFPLLADAPRTAPIPPAPHTADCKPQAPVRVELVAGDLSGGRARVDYTLTPVMDAVDLDVEVVLPQGGAVRWHQVAPRGAAQRGESRVGALQVDLPDGPGVEVEIRAHVTIPDPDGVDGLGTYTTTEVVTWGTPERRVDAVTEVFTDGELTLDTAATRL